MIDEFTGWFRDKGRPVRWVTAGAALLHLGGSIAKEAFKNQDKVVFSLPTWAIPIALHGLQAIAVLALIMMVPQPHLGPDKAASKAVKQFRLAWEYVLISWLALYGLLAARAVAQVVAPNQIPGCCWDVVLNLVNNLTSAMIFICYVILSQKTVGAHGEPLPLPYARWIAIAMFAFIVEGVGDIPSWSRDFSMQTGGWFSGLAGGVALAMLIGRLDSKFLDAPIQVLALLYLYAVIQGPWGTFDDWPRLALVFTSAALILKGLLFALCAWLVEGGKLYEYMIAVRTVIDHPHLVADVVAPAEFVATERSLHA